MLHCETLRSLGRYWLNLFGGKWPGATTVLLWEEWVHRLRWSLLFIADGNRMHQRSDSCDPSMMGGTYRDMSQKLPRQQGFRNNNDTMNSRNMSHASGMQVLEQVGLALNQISNQGGFQWRPYEQQQHTRGIPSHHGNMRSRQNPCGRYWDSVNHGAQKVFPWCVYNTVVCSWLKGAADSSEYKLRYM